MAVERPYSEILEIVHSPVYTGVFVGVRESLSASGLEVGIIIASGDSEEEIDREVERDRAQYSGNKVGYHVMHPGDPSQGRIERIIGGVE